MEEEEGEGRQDVASKFVNRYGCVIALPGFLPATRGDKEALQDLLSKHIDHVSWKDQPGAIRNDPQEEQR